MSDKSVRPPPALLHRVLGCVTFARNHLVLHIFALLISHLERAAVFSDNCYLIRHGADWMLWDSGYPDSVADVAEGVVGARNSRAFRKTTLHAQLAALSVAPAQIRYVAFSHSHGDHVGNANLFTGATWLVRKGERDVMFSDPPSTRTEPENFSALKNSKTTIITTPDYDVFGDGSVVIKSAPGHSPDHQVLFVHLARTGPVVLSGDLYHYPEERAAHRVPKTDFNGDQTAASRVAIEAFLKKTGAQLWIQHDLSANTKLKKAPDYYE